MSCSLSSLQVGSNPLSSAPESSSPLLGLSSDVSLHALSFLDYPDLSLFFGTCRDARYLQEKDNQRLERSLFSRVHVFDRAHWKEYYGVIITDELDPFKINILRLRAFLNTFYGPNPTIPGPVRISVKKSCLIPTVVPHHMMIAGGSMAHCLQTLGELAEHPARGHAAKYPYQSAALDQHGMMKANDAGIAILLKGVVARGKPWSKESQNPDEMGQIQFLENLNANTGYGCETRPDAISQNTVVLAHHAVTGERPLGDETGIEGQWTRGRTRELIRFKESADNMVSGDFSAGIPGLIEGPTQADLYIDDDGDFLGHPDIGVVVLRKF